MNPAVSTSSPSEPASISRKDRQLHDLRFLEALQEALAGCRDVAAVHDSAIHRVAAAFDASEACLAVCEPISGALDIVHSVGKRSEWDAELLRRVATEAH